MNDTYFQHPQRLPKNALGAFYTLGDQDQDGIWCARCLWCDLPQGQAPTLLAPLTDENTDTYFVRQPDTDEELEQACCAIEVCCVDALRYGGTDPKILFRLRKTSCCDYPPHANSPKFLVIEEAKALARSVLAGSLEAAEGCKAIASLCERNDWPAELTPFTALAHEQDGHKQFGFDLDNTEPLIIDECRTLLSEVP
jgi:hypothetical protein